MVFVIGGAGKDLMELISMFFDNLFHNPTAIGSTLQLGVNAILSLLAAPIACFFCLTLGQVMLPKHRIIGAFIVLFGLGFISEILGILFVAVCLSNTYVLESISAANPMSFVSLSLWFSIFTVLVGGAVFYLLTRFLLNKHLNLE